MPVTSHPKYEAGDDLARADLGRQHKLAPGMALLEDAHKSIMDHRRMIRGAEKSQENPAVQSWLEEHDALCKTLIDHAAQTHEEQYGEHPAYKALEDDLDGKPQEEEHEPEVDEKTFWRQKALELFGMSYEAKYG